jgi:hypothetical protein
MSKVLAGVVIVQQEKGSRPARCRQARLRSAAGALRCSVYGQAPPLAHSRLRVVAFQGCGLRGLQAGEGF